MKLRTLILAAAGLVVLCVCAVTAAVFWVARTESGTRWLIAQIDGRAGQVLSIEGVQGTLAAGLSAATVRISAGGTETELRRVSLAIDVEALYSGRLSVPQARIGEVHVLRSGAGTAATAGAPDRAFGIPFDVELADVQVGSVRIEAPDAAPLEIGETSFAGTGRGERVELSRLRTSTAGVAIEADATLEWSEGIAVAADVAWSTEVSGIGWSGSGSVVGTPGELAFEHDLAAPVRVVASGLATLGELPRVAAEVEWQDFAWPGQTLVTSPGGRVEVAGWLDGVDFEGEGRLIVRDVEADVELAGVATRESVTLASLTFASAVARGSIEGTVGLEPVTWDLAVEAEDIDASRFADGAPSGIAASGRVTGALAPVLQWTVADAAVDGVFRDESFAASGGRVANTGSTWSLERISVEWGGNSIAVDGAIDEAAIDLSVNVDAPRIDHWSEAIAGSLSVEGRVGGSFETPALSGRATADSLTFGSLAVARAELEGSVSGIEGAVVDLEFRASGVEGGRPIAETVTGTVAGTTNAHAIAFDVESPAGSGRLRANGSLADQLWTARIDEVTVDQAVLGSWSLEEPSTVAVSARSLTLEESCLGQSGARFCIGGALGTDTERLDVTLESFDLGTLQFLLDERVTIAGIYDGSLHLAGPLERPAGELTLAGSSTRLSVSEAEAPLELAIERIALDASLAGTDLEFAGEVLANADAGVDFRGTLSGFGTPDAEIDGRLDGSWSDLAFLSILSPDVGRVSGVATLGLDFEGPLAAPGVSGEARWTGGEIAIPRWGVVVEDVDLTVSSPDGRSLEYDLTALAGEGRMRVTGTTELDAEAAWPTRLSVTGDSLAAIRLPEASVTVSPSLEVVSAWPRIDVTGTVVVPTAELSLDELPERAVPTSRDVVVHGRDGPEETRPLDVRADLRLVLGDDVRFMGSGLDAQLSGELGLVYRSGESAVASGAVFLDGEYTTLGQTLELDRGQLLFSGPIANPVLDVRGVRRFESTGGEVVVGVLVTGTVRQPVTRLFSEPSMSEGDIISYLVVGRPLSDSSQENSEALQTAALSLGLTQALPQIQRFGETIGLDELGLRTSEANTGELMAGKQISPRIYVRYTYGLMNRVGGLLLRFQLTDRLSLETRAGELKAMDLLFMVERD